MNGCFEVSFSGCLGETSENSDSKDDVRAGVVHVEQFSDNDLIVDGIG